MPYRARGPVLANGPPEYNGNTAVENTAAILAAKKKPTYYHQKRAWIILGYGQARLNRPNWQEFHQNIQALWGQLFRYDKSRDGRTARALILDALRTLGVRSLRWSTSTRMLHFASHDGTFVLPTTGPGKGTLGDDNAHTYLQAEPPLPYEDEVNHQKVFETTQWQKYHRYQGFFSIDTKRTGKSSKSGKKTKPKTYARYFRAIPVPEGPESVWYALSYWVGGRRAVDPDIIEGPYISSPWILKQRIWTFFMQTIKDSDHDRWRDYHMLQSFSERELEGYGELSLLRTFYASRQQGRAAYPVWPSGWNYDALFLIIADYFATQVIVFAIDACSPVIDPADGQPLDSASSSDEIPAGRPSISPQEAQASKPYQYRAYGKLREGEYKQIFLATSDWKHFDAVDWDQPARWKASYFPPNWPERFDKNFPDEEDRPAQPSHLPELSEQELLTYERPFNPDPAKITKLPGPWWRDGDADADAENSPPVHLLDKDGRPPCKQARYNQIPGELVGIPTTGLGAMVTAPNELVNPVDLPEQEDVCGPLFYSYQVGPIPIDICIGQRDVIYRFCNRIDIPGWGFKMPSYDMIDSWRHPDQPEVHDQDPPDQHSPTASTDDDKPLMGTTPGTMGKGTQTPSTAGKKTPAKGTPAKKIPAKGGKKTPKGKGKEPEKKFEMNVPLVPRWRQRRRKDGQKFDHSEITDAHERYQIRFGRPPKQNNGALDLVEMGKNVNIMANPELYFVDANELRM